MWIRIQTSGGVSRKAEISSEHFDEWNRLKTELHSLEERWRWLLWNNKTFGKELQQVIEESGQQLPSLWPRHYALEWQHVQKFESSDAGKKFLAKWDLYPDDSDILWRLGVLRTRAEQGGWNYERTNFHRDQNFYELRHEKQQTRTYRELATIVDHLNPSLIDRLALHSLRHSTDVIFRNAIAKAKAHCRKKIPVESWQNLLLHELGIFTVGIALGDWGFPLRDDWRPFAIDGPIEITRGRAYYVRYDYEFEAEYPMFDQPPEEERKSQSKKEFREWFLEEREEYLCGEKGLSDFEQTIKQALRRMENIIKPVE